VKNDDSSAIAVKNDDSTGRSLNTRGLEVSPTN